MATQPLEGTLDSWKANAQHWDRIVGTEGNKYWQLLELPCLRRLVPVASDSKALDLATGNGLVARWLASEGASVVATDGSKTMLELAAQRTPPGLADTIKYRQLDVTRESEYRSFSHRAQRVEGDGFDVVVMNTAMVDLETLEPLTAALPRLLSKSEVFVETMLHPVFITWNATRKIEVGSDPVTGRTTIVRSKVITQHLRVPPYRGIAHEDQPTWQLYFHRPLHELLGVFFRAGLVLDALE